VTARRGGPALALLALAIGPWLAGCHSGYPSQDAPPLTPQQMSSAQRIASLQAVGSQGPQQTRWRFALADRCMLEVRRAQPRQPEQAFRIALSSGQFDMDFDPVQQAFEVGLVPVDRSPEIEAVRRTVLLKAATWTDASYAFKILRHLQLDCRQAAADGPGARRA